MANENFTTYDETDEGTNVTVIASKVSWTQMDRDETSHVSDSKGVGHFSGDFTHLFECLWENQSGYNIFMYWALANQQADYKTIDNASGDLQSFGNENNNFKLYVLENGSPNTDTYLNPAESTLHYITLSRDDDGGANNTGQLVALIRTGSHSGNLEDTLTVDCGVGEQNDFEYIFGLMSFDDAGGDKYADG